MPEAAPGYHVPFPSAIAIVSTVQVEAAAAVPVFCRATGCALFCTYGFPALLRFAVSAFVSHWPAG